MLEYIRPENLPANWSAFDLTTFSRDKTLWDYQQNAVANAIKVLWRYYEDGGDYQAHEKPEINSQRKQSLHEWYRANGLTDDLDMELSGRLAALLTDYYPVGADGVLAFQRYLNRACFWMATGSGKTLVIVKLIEVLRELIRRGEIPANDILVLTHRDDLIEQLRKHVNEFNAAHSELHIHLRELRVYAAVKRENPSLFRDRELTVFYYRSDNLSDEQKEKIVDFRNYDDGGKWYVLLDEAHKGDKEDYSGEEKQKIVLKSLMVLAYARKFADTVRRIAPSTYHRPLLLTLVNSVNTEDADLKLFFRELERIGKGQIGARVWNEAKDELWEELKHRPSFVFEENEHVEVAEDVFQALTIKDLLRRVFNTQTSGAIEVSFRPSDKKQVAFKLTSSDRHFALMKTGDMPEWLKNELSRFNVNHRFEDEGFFELLNTDESDINVLMGSRAFYEGWDSNWPNVINFINIGTGTDAKKFILQSVGRGVRIEPVRGKRKRLLALYNAAPRDDEGLFEQIGSKVPPVETLFIFGTNRSALKTVIEHLDREGGKGEEHQLSLFVNEAARKHKLLIPVYKEAPHPLAEERRLAKFPMAAADFDLLRRYVNYISDDRVMLVLHDAAPDRISLLRQSVTTPDDHYKPDGRRLGNARILTDRVLKYLNIVPEEFDRLKPLEKEIRHFEHMRVELKDISELQGKIEQTRQFPARKAKLEAELPKMSTDAQQAVRDMLLREAAATYEHGGRKIQIKHVANHYYIPMILSGEQERISYIKHIVQEESEINFLNCLERYLQQRGNKFDAFDWWMFSKLDESLDDVYIPYYSHRENRIAPFKPDFIFWFQKGRDYSIVFVDPKGTTVAEYQHKIDWYCRIFEDDGGKPRAIAHNSHKARVLLRLFTKDTSRVGAQYRRHWVDSIDDLVDSMTDQQ